MSTNKLKNIAQVPLRLSALNGLAFALLGVFLLTAEVAKADEPLPLPRFASLKSNEVNMRTGPGTQHPIKWVYKRKGLPIEIIAEFNNWRKVRDYEGEEGWILRSLLSGRRTALLHNSAIAYSFPESKRAVMRLSRLVQVELKECTLRKCEVIVDDITGWVDKAKLWGVYKDEEFD